MRWDRPLVSLVIKALLQDPGGSWDLPIGLPHQAIGLPHQGSEASDDGIL